MALFVGLYVYDSTLLLYYNEALLIPNGRSGWATRFGSTNFTLKGKELCVPNPFLPAQVLLRLAWNVGGSKNVSVDRFIAARSVFTKFVPLVWSLALVTFVLLPFSLFGKQGEFFILLSFILIYTNVLLIVLFLWLDRYGLGLTGKKFALVALDILICPPFALNIIRKLSLSMLFKDDLINVARQLQTLSGWNETRVELLNRLNEEITLADELSERLPELIALRDDLLSEAPNVE